MKEDNIYNENATKLIKDVFPKENINYMIKLFMEDASMIMGNNYKQEALDFTIDIVKSQYSFLPVCYIASAFKKGALGKYGKDGEGRLVPRTINGWIEFEALEYNKYLAHKEQKEKEFRPENSMDLIKYPIGQAIIQKINWFKEGLLNNENWDRISLKKLAEEINKGKTIQFNDFI
jgi:hypothetical protein